MEVAINERQLQMLSDENKRLRIAGSKLAEAAIYVCSEYDGLHRLALSVSEWAKAMADEHGRGDIIDKLGISYTPGSDHFWINDGDGGSGSVEIRIEDIDEYVEAFNQIRTVSINESGIERQ